MCPRCWSAMRFISAPMCAVSGVPFSHDYGEGAVSAAVIADPPRYHMARAVAVHDGLAGRLVSLLKYGDRTDLAPWMARFMVQAGAEFLGDADLLVPVPLHATRFLTRRFNQSAELARHVAIHSGVSFNPAVLKRRRATRQQVGLDAAGRQRNVNGAFVVPDEFQVEVHGRNIVLIDDVITTGATIDAACRALAKAKPARIDVLAFSRAVVSGSN